MDSERRRLDFATRLQSALRRSAKDTLSDGDLVKLLARNGVGVTSQTVSNWRNGKHFPKLEQLPGLAETIDADPCELAFGKPTTRVAEKRAVWRAGSTDEQLLVSNYALLGEEQQALVRELIRVLSLPGKNGKRPGRRKVSPGKSAPGR